jgi:peptidoglycan lytic transglycosylase
MRRVAGVFPLNIHPATWAAAVAAAAVWVLAALYVADRIVSSEEPAPPRSATIAPEPSQIPNRAKKAARETIKQEARLAPEIAAPKPEVVTPVPEDGGEQHAPAETGRASWQHAPAETGRASWYDLDSETASGEVMDEDALTAAHPSLPLGTKVKVENLDNGRVVVVRINDRGPFAKDRIIDLSKAAAETIGMVEAGVARVRVSPVGDLVASNINASGQAAPLDR